MPYFVYKITPGITNLLKNLELASEFESFKEAKNFVKDQRPSLAENNSTLKIIFADNSLQAEEQLMEKRDAPILQEWEK